MKDSTHHHALLTEFRTLIRLALPIVVAQFAQTANGFVDTIMAGQLGPQALASVAVGSSIWVPVFLFVVGVMQGVTPFVARHHGAGGQFHISQIAAIPRLVVGAGDVERDAVDRLHGREGHGEG